MTKAEPARKPVAFLSREKAKLLDSRRLHVLSLCQPKIMGNYRAHFESLEQALNSLADLSDGAANPILIELAIWESFKFYGNSDRPAPDGFIVMLQSIISIFDDLGFQSPSLHYLDKAQQAA